MILVALMITFLPSIYSVFSRREAQVAMLEVRAGNPPSAVGMLLRHHRIGWLENMDEVGFYADFDVAPVPFTPDALAYLQS